MLVLNSNKNIPLFKSGSNKLILSEPKLFIHY